MLWLVMPWWCVLSDGHMIAAAVTAQECHAANCMSPKPLESCLLGYRTLPVSGKSCLLLAIEGVIFLGSSTMSMKRRAHCQLRGHSLQGTRDYVVDIEAGRHLHKLAKRPAQPFWAEGCDHENVEMSSRYIPHLRAYLQGMFGNRYG